MAVVDDQEFVRFRESTTAVRREFKTRRGRPPLGPHSLPHSGPGIAATRHDGRHANSQAEATADDALPENRGAPKPPTPLIKESPSPPIKSVDASSEVGISRLLHAIALKEAAVARWIHVEVEKAECASRQRIGALSFEDVMAVHRSAADMIYAIARKEELLVAKLTALQAIVETLAGVRKSTLDEEQDEESPAFL